MTLFEHFNTSNQTSPRFERHENFVIELRSPGCAIVQIFDYSERCSFVQGNPDCKIGVQLFDYTDLFYCQIQPHNQYAEFGAILLLGFMGYLFMGFAATTTDEFFCPPLKVITNLLGISENLAGITLLAFGNSAPDLIGNISSTSEQVSTIYSDSVGSAMFITAFISGIIILMSPFRVESTSFVRDIAFHVLAIAYINYAIKSGRVVGFEESIVMLCLYPVYFIIIMIDQYLLVITLRSKAFKLSEIKWLLRYIFADLTNKLKDKDIISEADANRLKELQAEAGIEIIIKPKKTIVAGLTEEAEFVGAHANDKLFLQLINSLMPIDMRKWRNAGSCKKIFLASRCPIDIVLFALLPTVDYDRQLTGWSKLLNCIQTFLLPAVILTLNAPDVAIYEIPIWAFSLVFTVPLGAFIFAITRTDTAPKFHILFGIGTIIASVTLIRVFTVELINIIVLFGMVTYRSLSFLGCTVTSFGDSVGDLLSSIQLARQGYQKMGLAACIAGPLFYLTVGLGCIFAYKCYMNEPSYTFDATQGSMGENCTIFLMANLTGMLLSGVVTDFNLRRSIGVFLIINYILFCLYCLLGDFEIIHPFGTDHTEDYGISFM